MSSNKLGIQLTNSSIPEDDDKDYSALPLKAANTSGTLGLSMKQSTIGAGIRGNNDNTDEGKKKKLTESVELESIQHSGETSNDEKAKKGEKSSADGIPYEKMASDHYYIKSVNKDEFLCASGDSVTFEKGSSYGKQNRIWTIEFNSDGSSCICTGKG